jgi:hypothetical protein
VRAQHLESVRARARKYAALQAAQVPTLPSLAPLIASGLPSRLALRRPRQPRLPRCRAATRTRTRFAPEPAGTVCWLCKRPRLFRRL